MSQKLEDIKKYLTELTDAYDEQKLFFRDNTDKSHNAAIMLVMLQKSHDIKMYCGKMSVFRNGFYNDIANDDEATSEYLRARMASALSSYLKDGKSLKIILENKPENINDTIIPKSELESAFKNNHFMLSALPDGLISKKGIDHFSYGDNQRILRWETDKVDHQATCRIGVEPISSSAEDIFTRLGKIAIPVKI